MKMNKTQLKEAVKAVVRECLNERVLKELAPPGNGMEEGDVHGADSKVTVIDDIARFVIRRVPAYKGNPDKIAKVVALLFHKMYGRVADGEAVMNAVERNMGYEDQVSDTPVSDTPSSPKVAPAEEGDEADAMSDQDQESQADHEWKRDYEPKKKKSDKKQPPPESEDECGSCEEESVDEGTSAKTQTQGYRVVPNPSVLTRDNDDEKEEPEDPRLTETSAKSQTQGYRVAPNPAILTRDNDDEKEKPTDPRLTETVPPIKMAGLVNEKNWIQKAVNPAHKGYCTPMTKSTCTPQRKALAQRFKHGDIHKDNVGEAGLTSETGEEGLPIAGNPEYAPEPSPMGEPPMGEPEGEGYDEREEIKLIKVVAKAAERLEAMHAGMPGDEEEPEIPIKKEFPSTPMDDTEPTEPSASGEKKKSPEKKDKKPADKKKKKPDVDEAAYKVQHRSAMTSQDVTQDPKAMGDPENPMRP